VVLQPFVWEREGGPASSSAGPGEVLLSPTLKISSWKREKEFRVGSRLLRSRPKEKWARFLNLALFPLSQSGFFGPLPWRKKVSARRSCGAIGRVSSPTPTLPRKCSKEKKKRPAPCQNGHRPEGVRSRVSRQAGPR